MQKPNEPNSWYLQGGECSSHRSTVQRFSRNHCTEESGVDTGLSQPPAFSLCPPKGGFLGQSSAPMQATPVSLPPGSLAPAVAYFAGQPLRTSAAGLSSLPPPGSLAPLPPMGQVSSALATALAFGAMPKSTSVVAPTAALAAATAAPAIQRRQGQAQMRQAPGAAIRLESTGLESYWLTFSGSEHPLSSQALVPNDFCRTRSKSGKRRLLQGEPRVSVRCVGHVKEGCSLQQRALAGVDCSGRTWH